MAPPFGFNTTAAEIASLFDLSGKVALITGGYAGIGRETARVFASRGARTIIASRDRSRLQTTVDELKTETGNQNISWLELDLSSFDSVRKAADDFKKLDLPLNYLILNAAVMACPFSKTKDGFELQFGTNFLGHFLLANLLVPNLTRGAPSRVVSVASSGHHFGGIQWDDVNFDKIPYNPWVAYGQSKTANILFSIEFTRRFKAQGIVSSSLHPGRIKTELQRHVATPQAQATSGTGTPLESVQNLPGFKEACSLGMDLKTTEQGAATTLFAALSPDAAGGKFYNDSNEWEPAKFASDPENAKRLWDLAEKWVGL